MSLLKHLAAYLLVVFPAVIDLADCCGMRNMSIAGNSIGINHTPPPRSVRIAGVDENSANSGI